MSAITESDEVRVRNIGRLGKLEDIFLIDGIKTYTIEIPASLPGLLRMYIKTIISDPVLMVHIITHTIKFGNLQAAVLQCTEQQTLEKEVRKQVYSLHRNKEMREILTAIGQDRIPQKINLQIA